MLHWLFVAHFGFASYETVGNKANFEAVLSGVSERFQGYDTRHDLVIASVTLPQFRLSLRWLDDDEKKGQARTLLYEQVRFVQLQQQTLDEDVSGDSQA